MEEEARQEMVTRVIVDRQQCSLAKAFILNLSRTTSHDFGQTAEQYSKERGFSKPGRIALRPEIDEFSLAQAAGYLTSVVSIAESTWALVHEGVLLVDERMTSTDNNLRWTTVVSGSGSSGGWQFEEFSIRVPAKITFAPSCRKATNEWLTDPNLFRLGARLEDADSEVLEAVEDAVGCFRKELYRASVVLLGKAMEGAWIEVGIALANLLSEPGKAKFIETMAGDAPLARKINEVIRLYKNKELLGDIQARFGIRPGELESIVIWSDVLRDGRNAIHFGVKPLIPNDYEKVSVLLLAAANNLSKLYHIKRVAAA